MSQVVIRNARDDEASAIQALARQCPPLDVHTAFSYWVVTRYQQGLCLVAEQDDSLVGFLTATGTTDTNLLYVWQIGVNQAHRGTGLAERLLDRLVAQATALGFRSMQVSIADNNAASLAVFSRLAARRESELTEVGHLRVTDSSYPFSDDEPIYELSLVTAPPFVHGHGPSQHLELFVYGNLRHGQSLHNALEGLIEETWPAAVSGRLYEHSGGTYPVLLPGEGQVRGELLRIKQTAPLKAFLFDEEALYGYDLRWVLVQLRGESARYALAFTWPWGSDGLGRVIDSGDYLDR